VSAGRTQPTINHQLLTTNDRQPAASSQQPAANTTNMQTTNTRAIKTKYTTKYTFSAKADITDMTPPPVSHRPHASRHYLRLPPLPRYERDGHVVKVDSGLHPVFAALSLISWLLFIFGAFCCPLLVVCRDFLCDEIASGLKPQSATDTKKFSAADQYSYQRAAVEDEELDEDEAEGM